MDLSRRYRILIVDDNETFRNAFKHTLRVVLADKIEYIEEATNGEEAICQIKFKTFDYIFMDVKMPVMDGIQATKLADFMNLRLNIIALSFHKEFDIVKQIIEAGARNFLFKDEITPENLKKLFDEPSA